MNAVTSSGQEHSSLQQYYRLHAGIYDATRWSFLFGRKQALELVDGTPPTRILEVGCGTGANIEKLCRMFPRAEVTGVDLSAPMLEQASAKTASCRDRVNLVHAPYNKPLSEGSRRFDLVVCSYSLSMFNPGWEEALQCAYDDLMTGGRIVVVDFLNTPFSWFGRWMRVNHVRMEAHLQPALRKLFTPEVDCARRAYGGVWRYLTFVGRKTGEGVV